MTENQSKDLALNQPLPTA